MTNELFGVDIAAIVADTFTGNLHPLTLYRISRAVDDYGVAAETAVAYAGGDGVRGSWKSETMIAKGWPENTAKITIIRNGVVPDPQKGDLIEILGERFRVLDLSQDPVNATWTAAAVLETGATVPEQSIFTWGNDALTWG